MKFHCICVWLFAANFASVYNAVLEEAFLNEERIEDGFIAEHASDFKMIKTNLINMRLIPNTFNIGLGMLKNIFSRFTNSSESTEAKATNVANESWLWFLHHDSADLVNTRFFLRTPSNRFIATRHTPMNWTDSWPKDYDWTLPLKIVIHGFSQSSNDNWIKMMSEKMFSETGNACNIIEVDWSNGAKMGTLGTNYFRSKSNTKLVGEQVARLVHEMEIQFGDPGIRGRTHIIGFSLGAHVAGNAGMHLAEEGRRLGTVTGPNCKSVHRITGLDPAGFQFENAPASDRLDPSDACFVDVIHTNAGSFLSDQSFGIIRHCGHVDFYPNGGASQPGCSSKLYFRRLVPSLIHYWMDDGATSICNHFRAVVYFTQSISAGVLSSAFPCDSLQKYENGECFSPDQVEYIGYDWRANNSHKEVPVFQVTRSTRPYLGKQMKITVTFSKSLEEHGFFGPSSERYGNIKVFLKGARGEEEAVYFPGNQELNEHTKLERVAVFPYDFVVNGAFVEYVNAWGLLGDYGHYVSRTGWNIGLNITVRDGEKGNLSWSGGATSAVLNSGIKFPVPLN